MLDPADVRWIWITHPDRDHTGGLWKLLHAAPQARLVTTFLGIGTMSTEWTVPLDRVFLNPGQALNVGDFIHGTGTALSPPLVWTLAQALLTWLAWNQMNRKSTWGVIGLALFDATVFVSVLGEPITYELLNPVTFNPLLVVIRAGMIIIPLAMMVFAIQEWREGGQKTKQKKAGSSEICVDAVSGGQDHS